MLRGKRMARPRNRQTKDLPANLYYDPRYRTYHYRRPDNGKKSSMGTDKTAAIQAARKLNGMLTERTDLVNQVLGDVVMLADFIDTYRSQILPPRELSDDTLDLYEIRLRQLKKAFPRRAIDSITLREISSLLDTLTPRASNQLRAVAVDLWQHAAAKGLVPDNPPALTIPRLERKQRKRHTLEGLMKIREHAEPWLQNAIDLALITAQRRQDILNLRFEDIRDGRLHMIQAKTKKSSDAGYLSMRVTPQLQRVIARCRDSVPSPFLIHRRPTRLDEKQRKHKKHWTKVERRYLTRAFKQARDAANAYPDYLPDQQPGFHEIRALAQHLYKKAGKDPQKIAGIAKASTTKNYLAEHEDIIWNETEPDLEITGITG